MSSRSARTLVTPLASAPTVSKMIDYGYGITVEVDEEERVAHPRTKECNLSHRVRMHGEELYWTTNSSQAHVFAHGLSQGLALGLELSHGASVQAGRDLRGRLIAT